MRSIVILLLLFQAVTVKSQVPRIEDIASLIANASDENEKGRLLITRSKMTGLQQPEAAFHDAQQALSVYQKTGNKEGQADAYLQMSGLYSRLNKYRLALDFDSVAYSLASNIGYKRGIATAYSNMGRNIQQLGDFVKAKELLTKSLVLMEEAGLQKEMSEVYNRLGVINRKLSNFKLSLKMFDEGIAIAKKYNLQPSLANLYMNKANALNESAHYDEAIQLHLQCLKIREQLKDIRGLAQSYNNIATVYLTTKQYDASLSHLQKAAELSRRINNVTSLAVVYNTLAQVYGATGHKDSVLYYYNKSTELYKQTGDKPGVAMGLHNMGQYLIENGKAAESLSYLRQALAIRQESKSPYEIASTMNLIGVALGKLERHKEAEQYLLKSLSLVKDDGTKVSQSIYKSLADHYKATGRYEDAFKFQAKYISIADTAIGEGELTNMLKAQAAYEIEKREAELGLNKAEKQVRELQLSNRNKTILLLVAGVVFLAATAAYGIRNYRLNQMLKVETLRKKISKDLHDDIGSTLSSINIYSELAKKEKNNDVYLNTIQQHTQTIISSLDDLVWSINPKNDTIEILVEKLRSFAEPFLNAAKIKTQFTTQIENNNLLLTLTQKTNLYLACKEMVNNVVKHSGADYCQVSIVQAGRTIEMEVKDNGKGFMPERINNGRNGLRNLKTRAEELNGEFVLSTHPGSGSMGKFRINM